MTAPLPPAGDEVMTVRLTGPAVTEETIREAGEAAAGLVNAVAESLGLPPDLFEVGEARIVCDGDSCDAHRAVEGDAPGWHRTAAGLDFCPRCVAEEDASR